MFTRFDTASNVKVKHKTFGHLPTCYAQNIYLCALITIKLTVIKLIIIIIKNKPIFSVISSQNVTQFLKIKTSGELKIFHYI